MPTVSTMLNGSVEWAESPRRLSLVALGLSSSHTLFSDIAAWLARGFSEWLIFFWDAATVIQSNELMIVLPTNFIEESSQTHSAADWFPRRFLTLASGDGGGYRVEGMNAVLHGMRSNIQVDNQGESLHGELVEGGSMA